MQIRQATEADVLFIMQLIAKVVPLMRASGIMQWDDTYPNPEVFLQDIALNQLWVAEIEDKIVGVAALTTEQYPEYADVGLDITEPAIVTHRLAIDPDVRGKGIAKAFLQKGEEIAIERKYKTLRIDTNSINKIAGSLFENVGYKFCGEMGLKFRPGLRFNCYEKRL